MLQSPTPSNDEIRGDWSNLKGTDYHLVYVIWLLLRRRASQVAFYRGNDLLATPVPPVHLHQDQEPQLAMFAHEVGDVEDLWIQLKSGFAAWTVSSLLSGNLLPNFLVNAFTSETEGRRWRYFRLWRMDGTWERLNAVLREQLRIRVGRNPEPSAVIIDSQSVRTTGVGGVRGYDGAKRVNGRKRHILVDTGGLVLRAKVPSWDQLGMLQQLGVVPAPANA